MSQLTRRQLLKWSAMAPVIPRFLVESAEAVWLQDGAVSDGPIVIIVRMLGGNDGLNTVIPIRDDRYFKARPTIAVSPGEAIPLPGRDLGLNPWLSDVYRLIEDGYAGIVQGVGYPQSSRSHTLSTEIWETAAVSGPPPAHGWMGRYLDHVCEGAPEPMAGVQFADTLGRTLQSQADLSKSVANPHLLLDMDPEELVSPGRVSRFSRLDYLQQVENELGIMAREIHRAEQGSGNLFDYPDTVFGQSLRWTGNMIETGGPTRVYYVTIGSFDSPGSASFDTHVDELAKHRILFSEFGRGLRAFAGHMQRAGQLDRVLLVTFSDFGRLVEENDTHGTEHGDASVLFVMGGRVRAGLLGEPADLGKVQNGGLEPTLDFRQVYASVLEQWLGVETATVLGERITPFRIVAEA